MTVLSHGGFHCRHGADMEASGGRPAAGPIDETVGAVQQYLQQQRESERSGPETVVPEQQLTLATDLVPEAAGPSSANAGAPLPLWPVNEQSMMSRLSSPAASPPPSWRLDADGSGVMPTSLSSLSVPLRATLPLDAARLQQMIPELRHQAPPQMLQTLWQPLDAVSPREMSVLWQQEVPLRDIHVTERLPPQQLQPPAQPPPPPPLQPQLQLPQLQQLQQQHPPPPHLLPLQPLPEPPPPPPQLPPPQPPPPPQLPPPQPPPSQQLRRPVRPPEDFREVSRRTIQLINASFVQVQQRQLEWLQQQEQLQPQQQQQRMEQLRARVFSETSRLLTVIRSIRAEAVRDVQRRQQRQGLHQRRRQRQPQEEGQGGHEGQGQQRLRQHPLNGSSVLAERRVAIGGGGGIVLNRNQRGGVGGAESSEARALTLAGRVADGGVSPDVSNLMLAVLAAANRRALERRRALGP